MIEDSEFERKPIQRMNENLQLSSRLQSGSKPLVTSQEDEENSTKCGAEEAPDDMVDTDWAPLSSTMALGDHSTPSSFMSDVSQIPESRFKTPSRSRRRGGADPDLSPRWVTERTPERMDHQRTTLSSSRPGPSSQQSSWVTERTPERMSHQNSKIRRRTPFTGLSRSSSGTKINFRDKMNELKSTHSRGGLGNPSPASPDSTSNPFDSGRPPVIIDIRDPGPGQMMSSWTQTGLTLSSVLPAEVEAILQQHSLTDAECREPPPEASSRLSSNSSLRRRRLKFDADPANESADTANESYRSTSPETEQETEDCVPDIPMTPGKVLNTPQSARRTHDAWSSSPVRGGQRTVNGIKTNFRPMEHLGSPMFSPIVKGRRRPSQDSEEEEGEEMEASRSEWSARQTLFHDLTSEEMYHTAEINDDEDAEIQCDEEETEYDVEEEDEDEDVQETDSSSVSHVSMEVDSASRDGRFQDVSMASMSHSVIQEIYRKDADELEGGSKADTGYGESKNTLSSASIYRLDSVVRPSTNVTDNNAPAATASMTPLPGAHQNSDNSVDTSVGFPLGSSTPSKD